jgi:hypothetical protein
VAGAAQDAAAVPPAAAAEPGETGDGKKGAETVNEGQEQALLERAKAELSAREKKSILSRVGEIAGKLGHGAGAWIERVRKAHSPEGAVEALDEQLAANRARREPLAKRHEELFAQIAAKKKAWQAAPPAKKRLLELELKGMLAEWKGLERQLEVLLENERVAATVRGRTMELIAMGLRKIREGDIDKLTDNIEEASAEAEDVSGALDDLEKAGARREREGGEEAFAAELAGFDFEEEPAAGAGAPEASGIPDLGVPGETERADRKAEEDWP